MVFTYPSARLFQQFTQEFLAPAAGHFDGAPILHDDRTAPAFLVFLDPGEIDDMGIVDTAKDSLRQYLLIILDRPRRHDGLAIRKVDRRIVALGLEPNNILHRHEDQPGDRRDRHLLLRHLQHPYILEQNLHLLRQILRTGFFTNPADGITQIVDVDGLQQIIYGTVLKGPDGVVVESRYEYNLEIKRHQLVQQIERVSLGHFDVQEDKIGFGLRDQFKGRLDTACCTDDVYLRAKGLQ